MAANKITTMLTKNTSKILLILGYAFLEWVLIILLLLNSFFSYLIRNFAAYFNLKPPCLLCSRVDHVLQPSKNTDPYENLVCEKCFSSKLKYYENSTKYSPNVVFDHTENDEKVSMIEEIIEEEKDGCTEYCGGDNHSGSESCDHQIISDVGSFYVREEAEEDSNEDEEIKHVSIKENTNELDHAPGVQAVLELDNHTGGNKIEFVSKEEVKLFPTKGVDHLLLSAEKDEVMKSHDVCLKIQQLKSELDEERNAASIAANQTMAMITRLQEEKSTMQMEAIQYRRVMEEQADYHQEALHILNEQVIKLKNDKQEVEKELGFCRQRVFDYEAKDKKMMMSIRKCGNFSASSSIDNDSDVLSIDLNREYNKNEDNISLLDCVKQWGEIEDSLEELEEERFSIMKQLKELEEKLYEGKEEGVKPTDLCSQEVNLVPSCFSTGQIIENHPKSMASVARKLLDLIEEGSNSETEDKLLTNKTECEDQEVSIGSTRFVVEKEMDHVYGRLQALEAEIEFLRHCIGSVDKGSKGVNLLQEILQYHRELRAAEICF